jgi:hypothetical protein
MKATTLILTALSGIVFVSGHVIHIDVDHNGDVELDIDVDGNQELRPPHAGQSSYQIPYTGSIDGDYQLELPHGIHQGFLSASHIPSNSNIC